MKAVKKTGLVPVRHRGMIIGVPPRDAIKGIKSGDMVLFPIRSDIETIDVPGLEPEVAVKADETVAPVENLVDIPDDWRTVHGAKRAMLAKKILGLEPSEKLPVTQGNDIGDFAIEVIEAELARRGGNSAPSADDTNVAAPVEPVSPEPNSENSAETPSA